MATKEQADELARLFSATRPQQMGAWQQRGQATGSEGMLGVLLCLGRADGPVSAGTISRMMRVTTGRVSVLTKKLEEKGLVTRQPGAEDARVTEIALTSKGRSVIEDLERQRTEQFERLIDTVGMDRLKEYLDIQKEIYAIVTPVKLDL